MREENFFLNKPGIEKEKDIDPVHWEGIVLDLVESLPDSSEKGRWDKLIQGGKAELEGAQLKKMAEDIMEFIRGSFDSRKKIFKDNKEEIFFELRRDLDKEKIVSFVEKIITDPDNFVGKGKTASICQDDFGGNLCFKIINCPKEYYEGNTVGEEAMIMSELSGIKIRGANLPKPYYYLMSPECHLLVMEHLNALPMSRFMEGSRKLPGNFEMSNFNALKKLLREMHKLGVAHEDIHEDNIMIDLETGELYLIDFGISKRFSEANGDSFEYKPNTPPHNDLVRLSELISDFKAKLNI
jgi:serine/threonine protein kinase